MRAVADQRANFVLGLSCKQVFLLFQPRLFVQRKEFQVNALSDSEHVRMRAKFLAGGLPVICKNIAGDL